MPSPNWPRRRQGSSMRRGELSERLIRRVIAKAATATFLKAPELCADAALALAPTLIERGDAAGAIEALQPRLAGLVELYITAVTLSDIEDCSQRLAHTAEFLFESYARLGDWPAAFDLLDRVRALRSRHRRALRHDAAGGE